MAEPKTSQEFLVVIETLTADLVDEMHAVNDWCDNFRSLQQSYGRVYDEREGLKKRVAELEAEIEGWKDGLYHN